MEQLELEYLSKKDIKDIKKLDRLLKKSPYLRAFLDTLRCQNEKLREDNEALKKELQNENMEFKKTILNSNKEITKKVEEVMAKVELKEENDSQILNEYLYGKVDDRNGTVQN